MRSLKQETLKQHFTEAKQINDLMCHLLGSVEGCAVLEPSVGHGAFLSGLAGRPSRIDAVDIDGYATAIVRKEFSHLPVETFCEDFVDLFVSGLMKSSHPIRNRLYDAVISNPPYGVYLERAYRKRIKSAFPDLYARETFGLFFVFAVSRLREAGRYVFLMPDTFLSSVNHRPLRAFMCSHGAPTQIIRFPSRLFETVNFGYGNLCIVAGRKGPLGQHDVVQWLDAFDKDATLTPNNLTAAASLSGGTLIENAALGWSPAMFDGDQDTGGDWQTLADVAECRTGIYTGHNERFIGYDAARITRRLNGHSVEWRRQVYEGELTAEHREVGLSGARHYVPLVRGGHREAFDRTAWSIDWSPEALEFYRTDKKARFQNARFYFSAGLSVPMVTTKRISAALLSGAVFDQGVVGIFPHKPAATPALLLYLNSQLASDMMKKIVNGSANNSANYLKRLPIPLFSSADCQRASRMVEDERHRGSLSQDVCNTFAVALTTAKDHHAR